jgi:hypothetical protein
MLPRSTRLPAPPPPLAAPSPRGAADSLYEVAPQAPDPGPYGSTLRLDVRTVSSTVEPGGEWMQQQQHSTTPAPANTACGPTQQHNWGMGEGTGAIDGSLDAGVWGTLEIHEALLMCLRSQCGACGNACAAAARLCCVPAFLGKQQGNSAAAHACNVLNKATNPMPKSEQLPAAG